MKKLTYIVLLFLPFLTFGQMPEPVSGTVDWEMLQQQTFDYWESGYKEEGATETLRQLSLRKPELSIRDSVDLDSLMDAWSSESDSLRIKHTGDTNSIPPPGLRDIVHPTQKDTTYGVFAMIQSYDEPTAVWTWPGMVVQEKEQDSSFWYVVNQSGSMERPWKVTNTTYHLQIGRRYPMIEGVGEILYSMNIPRPIYKEIEESDFLMFKARSK
ncbi:MAG: hypothetical protein AAGH79_08505 [Bacteroidota bacterium]